MNDSTADDALARWHRAHAAASMVGWDFSRLDGRMTADEPWWDFERDCRKALATSSSALDLGTGGGERLIQLLEQTPERGVVHATEGWAPNVEVARANLAPLGVEVRPYDAEAGDRLPYDDGSMDLVMSRHEAIDPAEVARVLTPGGRLLTQQVHGLDAPEIHEWFGAAYEYPHVTAERFVADLEAAGLRIDAVDDWTGTMEFADVEALVTYLGLVPWDAPDFTVEDQAEALLSLDAARPIKVTQRRFRIHAHKES